MLVYELYELSLHAYFELLKWVKLFFLKSKYFNWHYFLIIIFSPSSTYLVSLLFIYHSSGPICHSSSPRGFLGDTSVKEPDCQCRRHRRCGYNSWSGRSPGGGSSGVATHSSILAWKSLQTEEPGRLQARVSQWVRHEWSNLTH